MAKRTTGSKPDLLDLAFQQIAAEGLAGFSRVALARGSGRKLAEVYEEFPTRTAVLAALGRRLDRAMLAVDPAELDGMTVRERLFELIMRRLEAMAPYREGLRRLARESRGEPALLLRSLCNLERFAGWLMEAAGIRRRGLLAVVAGPALICVYVRTFDTWLTDESPDLARTLAALDRDLGRLERLAGWVTRRPTAGGRAPPAAEPAAG